MFKTAQSAAGVLVFWSWCESLTSIILFLRRCAGNTVINMGHNFECNTTVMSPKPLFPVLSLNTILWSGNAIKIVLKTERAVFPGTLFKGWVKRHPNEEWQRYPARGQLPHSPWFFSERDKSVQGSSVILRVAAEGDLSFSDKGFGPRQRSLSPSAGKFMRCGGVVCAAHLVTQQSTKGLHNKTIRVFVLLISSPRTMFRRVTNDAPPSRMHWYQCSKGAVKPRRCDVQHFLQLPIIKFTFKELQSLNQFTRKKNIQEKTPLYLWMTSFHYWEQTTSHIFHDLAHITWIKDSKELKLWSLHSLILLLFHWRKQYLSKWYLKHINKHINLHFYHDFKQPDLVFQASPHPPDIHFLQWGCTRFWMQYSAKHKKCGGKRHLFYSKLYVVIQGGRKSDPGACCVTCWIWFNA